MIPILQHRLGFLRNLRAESLVVHHRFGRSDAFPLQRRHLLRTRPRNFALRLSSWLRSAQFSGLRPQVVLRNNTCSFILQTLLPLLQDLLWLVRYSWSFIQCLFLIYHRLFLPSSCSLPSLFFISSLIIKELVQISLVCNRLLILPFLRHQLRSKSTPFSFFLRFLLSHNLQFLFFFLEIRFDASLEFFDVHSLIVESLVVFFRYQHVRSVLIVVFLHQLIVGFLEVVFVLRVSVFLIPLFSFRLVLWAVLVPAGRVALGAARGISVLQFGHLLDFAAGVWDVSVMSAAVHVLLA